MSSYTGNITNEVKREADRMPKGTQHSGIPRVTEAKCQDVERKLRFARRALTGK